MVHMILRLRTGAAGAAEVSRALRTVMLPAQRDRACLRAQLHADINDPDALCYSEEWLTVEDVIREIRSTRFNRLLELMETASEPPELLFRFISETRGLEYVAEVRGTQAPATTN